METVAPWGEIIAEVKRAGGDSSRLCYQCGRCDAVCPWNRVRNFSIRRLVREADFGLANIEVEEMWRCTTCGACPAACPRGVGQIEVGRSLRRIAGDYGVFPGSASSLRGIAGSLASEGNPLRESRAERDAWANGLSIPLFAEGMEMLYFVGCYYSYDPRMKKVAVATAELLAAAGVEFGILGARESCCGESIRKAGQEDLFKSLARDNIKAFIDHGVKRILVSSPHCYHTFANEYPELMVRFELVQVTELLAELVASGRLPIRGELSKRVAFHDPCYLGRHNGIYDPPRELLRAAGVKLVEMRDTREHSLCCGGGGGRIWMDTPKGERFADLRLAQARDAGAEILATSCPYCISNFEEACLSLPGDEPFVVADVTEILREVCA